MRHKKGDQESRGTRKKTKRVEALHKFGRIGRKIKHQRGDQESRGTRKRP